MTHARRKQVIVGVVGLAALGAGAYAITDQLSDDKPRAAFVVPADVPTSSPSSASAEPADAPAPRKKATTSASTATTTGTKTKKQQIDAVRGAAAEAAQQAQRPVTSMKVNEADVTVKKVPVPAGTLQVVSAPQDLTGKRELAWVQGQKGEKVGAAACTQSITLAEGVPPKKRDTLLICWRISAAKSVYTIAIDPKGKPSAARSVAELNRVWSALR
ncbi:hypothetical protein [Actinoplanes sp. NBRC 103695]|uniref:hypothetical protein n=1 Tax=Actinoplanes sp. NBRC 103695 TaxID=3032202 RepID=UPI0024A562A2|nr:hypothetical protein [Actinoplanes sp. NBRC 103695]GLZ01700.1 hypothetical protein Acsp02_89510 [Actinoplanes sp. NBRC 103695]